jgi:quinohemoprotein ethanol dehydrogenase
MYRGPGDNLYANSIVAVRGATGKLVWYYQEVPGDDWDYDSNADLMLLDLPIGGKTRQVIMHAPKSGFFYVLDRLTGEVLSADPFTKVSWASGLEPKTGKPNVNAGARYGTEAVRVMPAIGRSWQPWTYSPMTGLVYFQAFAGESLAFRVDPDYVPAPTDLGPTGRGQANTGTRGANPSALPTPPVPLPMIGPDGLTGAVMFAWDPIARKERWRVADGLFFSGTLSTGGNLVFSSVAANLMAYHAETGEKLFGLRHGAAKVGAPISFSIDGKQYIAVAGRPSGAPNPHLLVFALDGKAPLPGVPLQ